MDQTPEHIVILADTGALKCLHCEQEFRADYPMSWEKLASYVEAFTWLHATCEAKDETNN